MNEQETKVFIEAGGHKTTGGAVVTDLTYMPSIEGDYKLVGGVNGAVLFWTMGGAYPDNAAPHPRNLDLRKSYSFWLNIYDHSVGGPYGTKDMADLVGADRAACINVTVKEGEGL